MVLIFTAGEETGCEGAKDLAESGLLPSGAGALVVGEPTDCWLPLDTKGHYGCGRTFGPGAHGSMPEAGDNAVYKAARAALALENFLATYPSHPQLGNPTVNVGTIGGGGKVNMVPDAAFLEIDLRTIPGLDHHNLENSVQEVLGPAARLTSMIDVPSVLTPQDDPWIASVLDVLKRLRGSAQTPGTVSYFTDASILYSALGSPPTLYMAPVWPARRIRPTSIATSRQSSRPAKLTRPLPGSGFQVDAGWHFEGMTSLLQSATFYVYVQDAGATYPEALSAEGESLEGPANQFRGDRVATIKDFAGNKWMIATHMEDVSTEELTRRAKKMMAA